MYGPKVGLWCTGRVYTSTYIVLLVRGWLFVCLLGVTVMRKLATNGEFDDKQAMRKQDFYVTGRSGTRTRNKTLHKHEAWSAMIKFPEWGVRDGNRFFVVVEVHNTADGASQWPVQAGEIYA